MAFNITFELLNDKATLAAYKTMKSKISSLDFRELQDIFSQDISFPEISNFPVDWELKKISGLPKGVEKHWMYLVQTENGKWFLCVYMQYFDAYCFQYGISDRAEKNNLLLRCLIHEFWHYKIENHPVVFDDSKMQDAVFQLTREQVMAEVEDELFCMAAIFGEIEVFHQKMIEYEYDFESYIKNELKNNTVTCKEVMQYLSLCEQQKWHYLEYSFRYENDVPCFTLTDLNTLVECFFPTLPPYNIYNENIQHDFSIPKPLVSQKTKFADVFNNINRNFFSKGESKFDGISFFCIANKQEENRTEEDGTKKVKTKKIVALGYKPLKN